jgi:hypothetical protein
MQELTQQQTLAVATGMVMALRNCAAGTAEQYLETESAALGLDVLSFAGLLIATGGRFAPDDTG